MGRLFRLPHLILVCTVVASFASGSLSAQSTPTADPSDVESIDAIMKAVYDVISGPAGQERDWDRWRSLFVADARLIPSGPRQDGTNAYSVLTPEDYATRVGPRLEEGGFFEVEIHRVTDQFGHIAQAFSTYESRRTAEDPEPFARGINSFQLMNDGTRWWVVTIYWTGERPDLPIPAKYLP
jgi:hypothetical protein